MIEQQLKPSIAATNSRLAPMRSCSQATEPSRTIKRNGMHWWGAWAWRLCAVLIVLAVPTSAAAQLIKGVPPGVAGYKLEIESGQLRPKGQLKEFEFRLSKSPAVPATQTERFTITVEQGTYYSSRALPKTCFATQVEIPVGAISVKGKVRVHAIFANAQPGTQFFVRVERGRGDNRFDGNDMVIDEMPIGYNRVNDYAPVTIRYLSSELKTSQQASQSYVPVYFWPGMRINQGVNTNRMATISTTGVLRTPNGRNQAFLLGMVESQLIGLSKSDLSLPDDWVGLVETGVIVISFADLQRLCEDTSSRETLERWVAFGGKLVVAGDGTFSHVDQIVPTLIGRPVAAERLTWFGVVLANNDPVRRSPDAMVPRRSIDLDNRWSVYGAVRQKHISFSDALAKGEDPGEFASLDYVQGRILAIRDLGNRAKKNRHFGLLMSEVLRGTPVAVPAVGGNERRQCMSPIPGVGNPPLVLFLILIFGFLTIIGPVMIYFVRAGGGRRHFLFFAVPVASLIACCLILGYAVIVNFSSQLGRVESVTWVHPVTGAAYSQTMAAYYCGSQPPYYEYNSDVIVYSDKSNSDDARLEFTLDGKQRISGDRISPRQLHFVFAQQAELSSIQLSMKGGDQERPIVENKLGGRIKLAIFKWQGKLFQLRDLDVGQQVVATPFDAAKAAVEFPKYLMSFQPEPSLFVRARPEFFLGSGVSAFQQRLRAAILNKDMSDLLFYDGEYVAIVDDDPVAMAVAQPFDYKIRNHIIYGKK